MSTTPEDRPDGTPREDEQAASQDTTSTPAAPSTAATPATPTTSDTPAVPTTEPVAQHPQEAPTQRISPAPTQSLPQASPAAQQAPTQPLHAPLAGPLPGAQSPQTAQASQHGAPGGMAAQSPQHGGPAAQTPQPSTGWGRPGDPYAVPGAQRPSPSPYGAAPQVPQPTAAQQPQTSQAHPPQHPGAQLPQAQSPQPQSPQAQGQQHPGHQPSARPTVSWGAPAAPAPQVGSESGTSQSGTPQPTGTFAGPYGAEPEHPNGGPEYPAAFGAPAPPEQQADQTAAEKKQRTRVPLIPMVAVAVITALVASGGTAFLVTALDRNSSTSSTNIATLGQTSADGVPVSGSSVENPDWQAVASAVKDSVVAIQVVTSAGEAEGSGVIADSDGNIITNNHVVSGAQDSQVQVTLTDGRIYTADVVGTDSTTDLAVIRLQDPPDDLSPAAMADTTPTVGDPVMAVGNPLGLANTVTTGIVSALDRPVSTTESGSSETVVTNAIQIDAAVNPGNSGGPLFNASGQVIGITSSIATTSSASGSIGLGFAIPISLAQMITGQLVQDGVAEHAYLGVGLTDGTATADGVTRAGAQVQSVSGNSPASKAGLQTGDVIVAIDDKVVGGAESLTGYVRTYASGDEVTLTVVRDGKSLNVEVTMAVREEEGTSSGQSGSGQQGQQGQGDSGDGSDGSGDGLENMTPEQLYEWFQQQQGGDQG